MAAQSSDGGEFTLIIAGHDAATLGDAAKAFANAFHLDEDVALQVVKSAPIIFVQRLTKSEVKAITDTLTELSGHGLEFRLTARPVGKMPKLNWPVRPQFTAGGSGQAVRPSFDWDHTAFVCPSCGETFQFKAVGKLPLGESVPGSGIRPSVAAATAAPKPKPAPAKPAPKPVEPEPSIDIAEDDMAEIAPLEPVSEEERLPGEGEDTIDLPDAVEEIRLDEVAADPVPIGDENALMTEEPAVGGEPFAQGEEGDQYNVFLSKIVDRSKQEKAVELIAKMKNIPSDEARELTGRLVIPIAKNIGKKDAESILEQFKKHKIFGRMTKVK